MNRDKLHEVSQRLCLLADEFSKAQAAYKRLSNDRGSSLTLVLGDYWKVPIAHQNDRMHRGMDMIVLGLQKHLKARLDEIQAEVLSLKAEIHNAAGGAS